MALNLFTLQKDDRHTGLVSVEYAGLVYNLITSILILILSDRMDNDAILLEQRFYIVVITFAMVYLYRIFPCKMVMLLRIVMQLAFLTYWYPDTYQFNRLFVNRDYWFASFEQWVFGCQPSLEFYKLLPQMFWSEAFNFGYFAYYFMIALVAFFYFFRRYAEFERTAFVLIASFFIYYLVFIALPVAGPQYYFKAIGVETAASGHFPPVGDYFQYHTEMLPNPGDGSGFFHQMVENSQEAGERPTAAFPSSHVGISTIVMLLAWRSKNRWLFFLLLPVYLLLCGATVYIQAHYLTDAICGFLSAIGVYFLTSWLFKKIYDYESKRTF